MQFSYVNYNPSDYKYGSQVGCIIKQLYPGDIKIYNDEGRIVAKRAALSWNDYTWGKHDTGLSHAKLVKHEFWSLFTVSRQHRRKADRNLDSYLRKRVSDLVHQARLDAVKKHEQCDDTRARTILLTEAEYIKYKAEWCSVAAWKWLSHYWTTDEFLGKRRRAQEARLKSEEDVAQNRGGSRPWVGTQQFLEYKFGSEKAGTINTYAVMKSGIKNVDSTGNSAPIPSQKARRRLEDYKAGVGPDDNSKELDGKVLYFMEGGLRHGRVPIGNGVVDKAEVLAAAKSKHVQPSNTASYRSVVKENEHLREMNQSLLEENGVNRELILSFYADFGKDPPTHLLDRLASIAVVISGLVHPAVVLTQMTCTILIMTVTRATTSPTTTCIVLMVEAMACMLAKAPTIWMVKSIVAVKIWRSNMATAHDQFGLFWFEEMRCKTTSVSAI